LSRRRRRYAALLNEPCWLISCENGLLTGSICVQMADLKENIEDEIHSAHDQYLKMDSHVKLYMNEIEHLM